MLQQRLLSWRWQTKNGPIITNEFTYKTIVAEKTADFRDRGSKFHAYVRPIGSREEVAGFLQELKDEHPKARHFCFAFRIGGQGQDYRIADDGEPAGSAGQPIYNQLLSFDLTNIIAVVVRYFGGTKLGIPGLINAYKSSTYLALQEATIKVKNLTASYEVITTYDHSAQVMNSFQNMNFDIVDVVYDERAKFLIKIPLQDHDQQLKQALTKAFSLHAVQMLEQIEDSALQIQLIETES